MYSKIRDHLAQELEGIKAAGLYKQEVEITSPQGAQVKVSGDQGMLNLCANNYLGLAQHSDVNAAAAKGLKEWGYGMASVRFICGTQSIHTELESALARFLKTEDCILYPSGSTPTVGCLKPYLPLRTRSFQMRLTTPVLSTVFVCAKPNVTATPTTI